MFKFLLPILFLVSFSVDAQTKIESIHTTNTNFTDKQLELLGLKNEEFNRYRDLKSGKEGIWWPDVSPLELLMYGARDEEERNKYAKRYLKTYYPKANSEKNAQIAMRKAAYEIVSERSGALSKKNNRGAIFINIACETCKERVRTNINPVTQTDLYFVNLNRSQDINSQMISWVKDAGISPQLITINDGEDLWKRNNLGVDVVEMEIIK